MVNICQIVLKILLERCFGTHVRKLAPTNRTQTLSLRPIYAWSRHNKKQKFSDRERACSVLLIIFTHKWLAFSAVILLTERYWGHPVCVYAAPTIVRCFYRRTSHANHTGVETGRSHGPMNRNPQFLTPKAGRHKNNAKLLKTSNKVCNLHVESH